VGNTDTHCYPNSDRNAYTYSYRNSDCNSDCDRDCNSDCDCHGDFYSHFHPNYNYDSTTNSDIYAYRYFDGYRNYHPAPDSHAYSYYDDYTQANAYGQAAFNAEGATHPAAAPDPAARIRFGTPRPLATVESVHGKGGPDAPKRTALSHPKLQRTSLESLLR
jgi:hypothetical protein